MEAPKIRLSSAESELMQNAAVILTKNTVLEKMKLLLEAVQDHQLSFVAAQGLGGDPRFRVGPKISRGENYRGLPWLILDYPRVSAGEDLFFVRSLFWWGQFFSSTLHLSGRHKKDHEERLAAAYPGLGTHFVGVDTDPWQHHFEETNYRNIGSMTAAQFSATCRRPGHLKIATYWSLDRWQQSIGEFSRNWEGYLQLTATPA